MKLKKTLTLAMAFIMFMQVIPPNFITLYAEPEEGETPPVVQADTLIDLTNMVRPSQAADSLTLQIGQADSGLSVPLTFQLALNRDFLLDPAHSFTDDADTGEEENGPIASEEPAPATNDTDVVVEGEAKQPSENPAPTPIENNNEESEGNDTTLPEGSPENINIDNGPATTLDTISYEVVLSGPFSHELNFDQQGNLFFQGFEIGTYTLSFPEGGSAVLNAVLDDSIYTAVPDYIETSVQIYLNEECAEGSAFSAEILNDKVVLSLLDNTDEEFLPSLFEGASIIATTFGAMFDFGFPMTPYGGGSGTLTSIDITNLAFPVTSTMPTGFVGAPDAFSEIILGVGSVNAANELKFSITATFNEAFLEWVMNTYISSANIFKDTANPPPDLEVTFEIQNPTVSSTLGTNAPLLTFPSGPIEFNCKNTKIGEINFAPSSINPGSTSVHVTFEKNVIYGAAQVEAAGEFSAQLSNKNAQGLIAGLVDNHMGGNFSVSWSEPPLVNFPDGQDYIIEKKALPKSLDSPYVTYEITVYGREDLSDTQIVDIFKPNSPVYGLTPLSFEYQLYSGKELLDYSPAPILLGTTPDITSSKADDYLLLNGPVPPANFPFDTTGFSKATDFASGTHPGTTFVFNPGDHNDNPDTTKKITKAVITMRTMIDQATYEAIMAETSPSEKTFENVASLYYNGDSSVEKLDSEKASAKVRMEFLAKEGKRKGLNGEAIEWTLQGSTYLLMTNNDAYVVDKIPDRNVHDYNLSDPDGITVNGHVISSANIHDFRPASYSYKFDTIGNTGNVDNIFLALGVNNPTDGSNMAVCLHGDGTESLLIISLGAGYVNEPFTVKYTTDLNTTDNSYNDKTLGNAAKLLISPNVWFYGKGPGQRINLPIAGGELDKTTTVRNGQAAKEAGFYNPTNQNMTWNIFVNDKREATPTFVIEEKIDTTKQVVLKIGSQDFDTLKNAAPAPMGPSFTIGNPGASMQRIDDSTTISLPATGNYYSINTVGTDVFIKFYFASIAANDWFFIPITTRVVDTSILTKQFIDLAPATISNTIKYGQYSDSSTVVTGDATVPKNITNDLISKEVLFPAYSSNKSSAYFYNDNTIRWKITANPNNLSIENPIITDLLPKELKFEAITKAYYANAPSTDIKGSLSAVETAYTGSPSIAGKNIVKFEFNSPNTITEPLIIEYSTKIKDDFMGSVDVAGIAPNTIFENQCYIDGGIGFWDFATSSYTNHSAQIDNGFNNSGGSAQSIFDDHANKTAKAAAEAPIIINPVVKTGTYHESATTMFDGALMHNTELVRWQIVVNKARFSPMVGTIIKDTLNTSGKVVFNPESLKIYVVELFVDGSVDIDSSTEISPTSQLYDDLVTKNDDGEIEIAATSDMDGEAFMIEFDALIISDGIVRGADISNKIDVTNSGYGGSTVHGDTGHSATDKVRDSSRLTYLPGIQIVKASTNTAYDNTTKLPLNHLEGVTFTLQGYSFSGSSLVNAEGSLKTAKTNSDGIASFIFLKPGLVYELRETAVGHLDGKNLAYEQNTDVRYIALKSSSYTYPADIGGIAVEKFNHSNKNVFYSPAVTINGATLSEFSVPGSANEYNASFVVLNKPKATSQFSFTKYDEQANGTNPLSGIKFQLEYKNSDISKTPIFATSNGSGEVTFTDLDPSVYIMSEVVDPLNPSPYTITGKFEVTVPNTPGAPATVTAVSPTAGQAALIGTSSPFNLINYVPRGDVSVNKKHFGTNANINNANLKFGVYLLSDNAGTSPVAQLVTSGSGMYKLAPPVPSSSQTKVVNGFTVPYLIEKFDDLGSYLLLAGDYYIKETDLPASLNVERALESTGSPDATRQSASTDYKKYYLTVEAGKTNRPVYTDSAMTTPAGTNVANTSFVPNYPNNLSIKISKKSNHETAPYSIPDITFELYVYDPLGTSTLGTATDGNFPFRTAEHAAATAIGSAITSDPAGTATLTANVLGKGLVEGKYIVVELPTSATDPEFIAPEYGPTQYLIALKSDGSITIEGRYEATGVTTASVDTSTKTLIVHNLKTDNRGKVRLLKIKSSDIGTPTSSTLPGAKFDVYAGTVVHEDHLIGTMEYVGGNNPDGTPINDYRIKPLTNPARNSSMNNALYLQMPDYGYEYELLPGTYTVVENTAPSGYAIMDTKGLPYIDQGGGTTRFGNEKMKYSLVIDSEVDDTPVNVKYGTSNYIVNLSDSNGTISGTKTARDGVTTLSGAKFDLYIKPNDHSFTQMNGFITNGSAVVSKYLVGSTPTATTPNGQFSFTGLADGDYILVETQYPKEHIDTKTRVYITLVGGVVSTSTFVENGVEDPYTNSTVHIQNERKVSRGSIQLTKQDSLNATQLLTGAEFAVYIKATNTPVAYLKETSTGIYNLSDKDGNNDTIPNPASKTIGGESYLYLDEFTEYGGWQLLADDYYVIETKTPNTYYGYTGSGSDIYYDGFVPSGATPRKYDVTILDTTLKTSLVPLTVKNTKHSSASFGGTKYTASGNLPIEGVIIGLYSINNISLDFDAATTKPIGQTTTDANGEFEFTNLPYGEFVVKEIGFAPSVTTQYNLSKQEYRIKVNALDNPVVTNWLYLPEGDVTAGDNVPLFSDSDVKFYNERVNKRSALELVLTQFGTSQVLSYAEYAICLPGGTDPVAYLVESTTTPGTYVLSRFRADGTGVSLTDNGTLDFLSNEHNKLELLEGSYEITELSYPVAHRAISAVVSGTPIPDMARNIADRVKIAFSITKDDEFVPLTDKNVIAPGRIDGSSIVNTGASLAGVKLGLFSVGTTSFTDANSLVEPVIAAADGSFTFANLPAGQYIIRAIEGVSGYYTDMNAYTITVTGVFTNPSTFEEIITTFADGTPLNIVSRKLATGGYIPPSVLPPVVALPPVPLAPPPALPPVPPVVPVVPVAPPVTPVVPPVIPVAPAAVPPQNSLVQPATVPAPTPVSAPVPAPQNAAFVPPTELDAKPIAELAASEVIPVASLPDNYKAVLHEDGVYIIYNEIGMALGYIVLEEGKSLDNIILDDIIPFGRMAVKSNPKTGANDNMGYNVAFMFIAIAVVLLKPFLPFKRIINLFKKKLPMVI